MAGINPAMTAERVMAINYEKLLNIKIPDVEQSYGPKDCMLYALGLGLGYDPVDENQLAFVYEKNLKVLPTMAAVIGYPGFWVKELDTGIDWVKVVAGEYAITLHRALAPRGTVVSRTRVQEIVDKGPGKGAVLYVERTIDDKRRERITTILQTFAAGWRLADASTPPLHPLPDRAPDLVCDLGTRPEAALIYRLSADLNPLHADLDVAKAAGYPRPILHGLATFGVVGHALLKSVCDYQPERMTAMSGRFSAPVFPGETIRTEIWRDGSVISFRALVPERNIVAMSNGRAEVKA
jgi:acyl dehydratase